MRETGGAMIDHAAAKQPIAAAEQALGRRIILLPAAAGAGIGNRMRPPPDLEGQPLRRRICITIDLRNRGTGS